MATILREWSYQYQWLYDSISQLAALSAGGESRFRQLALKELTITAETQVLDLCCGSGQTTRYLVERSAHVVGLDASPFSLQRAQQAVPQAKYVQSWAEAMPFHDEQFDLVHTGLTLHEMRPVQLWKTLQEVHRILRPGGTFTLIDFHDPVNPLFEPPLYLFLWLFETDTVWQFIKTNLVDLLETVGFQENHRTLYAGGSLQVIQARKHS